MVGENGNQKQEWVDPGGMERMIYPPRGNGVPIPHNKIVNPNTNI